MTLEALQEQNETLLAQLVEAEQNLDEAEDDLDEAEADLEKTLKLLEAKMHENEKLGTQVANLEEDIKKRDATIDTLRKENADLICDGVCDGLTIYEKNLQLKRAAAAATAAATPDAVLEPVTVGVPADMTVLKKVDWAGEGSCVKPHVERRRIPDDRPSNTYKLRIGDGKVTYCEQCGQAEPGAPTEAFVHVGFYPDTLGIGEFFVTLDKRKDGDLASVGFSLLARLCSRAIQWGVPVSDIYETLLHQFDEAGGWVVQETTDGKLIPHPDFHRVNGFSDLLGRVLQKAATTGPRKG